jgi:hypothetical protein
MHACLSYDFFLQYWHLSLSLLVSVFEDDHSIADNKHACDVGRLCSRRGSSLGRGSTSIFCLSTSLLCL